MSILDNEPCLGAFGQDLEPPLCERCGRFEAAPNDDWCQGCIDAEAEALADEVLADDQFSPQSRMLSHFMMLVQS